MHIETKNKSLHCNFSGMSWTVFQSGWVHLFGRLLECLLVAAFPLKLIRVLWVLVLGLPLDFYLVWLECLLIRWRTFKWNFWLAVHVGLDIERAWSSINQVSVFLAYEVCFVTALALELCILGFVFVCWLSLYHDRFWFVLIIVWSVWVKGYFGLSGKVVLSGIDFTGLSKIVCWLGMIDFFVLAFVTGLKHFGVVVFLLDFGHFELRRPFNG